jgi:hypothetical protein
VIVAEQVQHPVGQVTVQLRAQRAALGICPPCGRVQGDYHVTQKRPNARRFRYRKGEDVGGLVLPAPAAVEAPDPPVGGEHDGELGVGPPQRPEELRGAAAQAGGLAAASPVLDRDPDERAGG